MELYHVSPARMSIGTMLDPGRSQGRMPVVWLVSSSMLKWALKHIKAHQGVRRLTVYKVKTRRSDVRRRRRGVWYSWVPVMVTGRVCRA